MKLKYIKANISKKWVKNISEVSRFSMWILSYLKIGAMVQNWRKLDNNIKLMNVTIQARKEKTIFVLSPLANEFFLDFCSVTSTKTGMIKIMEHEVSGVWFSLIIYDWNINIVYVLLEVYKN